MSIFNKADILLPNGNVDLTKWSVIACDQYTSEPEYWERARTEIGEAPSTLAMVYPEVYLPATEEGIAKINAAMNNYLQNGIFEEYKNCLIYVERTQPNGRVRHGIVGAVDLEEYDYSVGSHSKIRATEGTVKERIPPRVKIREEAPLELPHIMLLINDEKNTVIKPCTGKVLYDFDLSCGGGHLKGTLVPEKETERIFAALSALENNAEGGLAYA